MVQSYAGDSQQVKQYLWREKQLVFQISIWFVWRIIDARRFSFLCKSPAFCGFISNFWSFFPLNYPVFLFWHETLLENNFCMFFILVLVFWTSYKWQALHFSTVNVISSPEIGLKNAIFHVNATKILHWIKHPSAYHLCYILASLTKECFKKSKFLLKTQWCCQGLRIWTIGRGWAGYEERRVILSMCIRLWQE